MAERKGEGRREEHAGGREADDWEEAGKRLEGWRAEGATTGTRRCRKGGRKGGRSTLELARSVGGWEEM